MAIHGSLTTMSVSDLLQFLAAGRKTGTLKFNRGEITKEIYFRDGTVVGANTNDPKDYLGQVLIHYGKIDEPKLQTAMEEQRRSSAKLGDILVQKGFLTHDALLQVIRARSLDIIYDLFVWEEAQFEFFDNEAPPADLIPIEMECTNIIMEGIYRVDELSRFRTLIPSDRAVLELVPGWTASLSTSKEVRQLLFFIEKHMTVAEICYNMHDSSFSVHARLFELISSGIARVAEEAPPGKKSKVKVPKASEDLGELLWTARREIKDENSETALTILKQILEKEPKNLEAQSLMQQAEALFVKNLYSLFSPESVPKLLISPEGLTDQQIGPQEAFVLSRINGEWDIQSILSICPFREADSLRMMKALLDAGVIGIETTDSKPYHT